MAEVDLNNEIYNFLKQDGVEGLCKSPIADSGTGGLVLGTGVNFRSKTINDITSRWKLSDNFLINDLYPMAGFGKSTSSSSFSISGFDGTQIMATGATGGDGVGDESTLKAYINKWKTQKICKDYYNSPRPESQILYSDFPYKVYPYEYLSKKVIMAYTERTANVANAAIDPKYGGYAFGALPVNARIALVSLVWQFWSPYNYWVSSPNLKPTYWYIYQGQFSEAISCLNDNSKWGTAIPSVRRKKVADLLASSIIGNDLAIISPTERDDGPTIVPTPATPRSASSTPTMNTTNTTHLDPNNRINFWTLQPVPASNYTNDTRFNTVMPAYGTAPREHPFKLLKAFRKNNDELRTLTEGANTNAGSQGATVPIDIYPIHFNNYVTPESLYMTVKFRIITGIDETTKEAKYEWVDLKTNKSNNFFKQVQIEDKGGCQQIRLTLFDKDFSNLEGLVRAAVASGQVTLTNPKNTALELSSQNHLQESGNGATGTRAANLENAMNDIKLEFQRYYDIFDGAEGSTPGSGENAVLRKIVEDFDIDWMSLNIMRQIHAIDVWKACGLEPELKGNMFSTVPSGDQELKKNKAKITLVNKYLTNLASTLDIVFGGDASDGGTVDESTVPSDLSHYNDNFKKKLEYTMTDITYLAQLYNALYKKFNDDYSLTLPPRDVSIKTRVNNLRVNNLLIVDPTEMIGAIKQMGNDLKKIKFDDLIRPASINDFGITVTNIVDKSLTNFFIAGEEGDAKFCIKNLKNNKPFRDTEVPIDNFPIVSGTIDGTRLSILDVSIEQKMKNLAGTISSSLLQNSFKLENLFKDSNYISFNNLIPFDNIYNIIKLTAISDTDENKTKSIAVLLRAIYDTVIQMRTDTINETQNNVIGTVPSLMSILKNYAVGEYKVYAKTAGQQVAGYNIDNHYAIVDAVENIFGIRLKTEFRGIDRNNLLKSSFSKYSIDHIADVSDADIANDANNYKENWIGGKNGVPMWMVRNIGENASKAIYTIGSVIGSTLIGFAKAFNNVLFWKSEDRAVWQRNNNQLIDNGWIFPFKDPTNPVGGSVTEPPTDARTLVRLTATKTDSERTYFDRLAKGGGYGQTNVVKYKDNVATPFFDYITSNSYLAIEKALAKAIFTGESDRTIDVFSKFTEAKNLVLDTIKRLNAVLNVVNNMQEGSIIKALQKAMRDFILATAQERSGLSQAGLTKITDSSVNLKIGAKDIASNLKVSIGRADYNPSLSQANGGVTKDTIESVRRLYGTQLHDVSGSDAIWNEFNAPNPTVGNAAIDNEGQQQNATGFDDIILYKNQNVIRSPEFEYFITGVESQITPAGLTYTLSGFSQSYNMMTKFQVLQKYMTYNGSPKELMSFLMKTFNEEIQPKDSGGFRKLYLAWGDEPFIKEEYEYEQVSDNNGTSKKAIKQVNGKDKIRDAHISFGGENSLGKVNLYKPLSSLLNEFTSSCPPLKITMSDGENPNKVLQLGEAGEKIIVDDNTEVENLKTYPMTWSAKEYKVDLSGGGQATSVIVSLYYRRPRKFPYIRNYNWGQIGGNSAVKSLSIKNKNEFATIASFSMYDKGAGMIEDISSYGMVVKQGLESQLSFQPQFVQHTNIASNNSSQKAKTAIDRAYKQALYEGTITVLGDPGLFFGTNLLPYSYPIKINIYTPSYKTNGTSFEEVVEKNYMSGVYVISSITHDLSSAGYTTTLGVLRYPGLEQELFGETPNQTQSSNEGNQLTIQDVVLQRKNAFLRSAAAPAAEVTPVP